MKTVSLRNKKAVTFGSHLWSSSSLCWLSLHNQFMIGLWSVCICLWESCNIVNQRHQTSYLTSGSGSDDIRVSELRWQPGDNPGPVSDSASLQPLSRRRRCQAMCIRVGVTSGLVTGVVIITQEPGPGHQDGTLGTSWRDKYPRNVMTPNSESC